MSNILSFPRTLPYVCKDLFQHDAEVIYLNRWLKPAPKNPSVSREEPFDPLYQPLPNVDEYEDEDEYDPNDWQDNNRYIPEDDEDSHISCFLVL